MSYIEHVLWCQTRHQSFLILDYEWGSPNEWRFFIRDIFDHL